MTLSLGDIFTPSFNSENAIIKHCYFHVSGNILNITYSGTYNIGEMIFKLILSRISYEREYHNKYDSNTLTEEDIVSICDTLNTSNFSQKDGLIAELILKDLRTHTHDYSNNYTNQPLNNYRITTTTTTGEDLLEVIFEEGLGVFVMRDARNDKDSGVNSALSSKLKKLYTKKRSVTEDGIRIIGEKNKIDVEEIIKNRCMYSCEKCIFILTGNNDINDFQSFIDKKISSLHTAQCTKDLFQEIKDGIKKANYVVIQIDNYSNIFEQLIKELSMPYLETKLRLHATI